MQVKLFDINGVSLHVHSTMSNATDADNLDPSTLKSRLADTSIVLVDVREPHEWAEGHLEGARHLPLGSLAQALDTLDPLANTVLYCKRGGRSHQALMFLRQRGFTRLAHLDGGIMAWIDAYGAKSLVQPGK